MSRRTTGTVLLLAGSELLGVLAGQWFFRLFLKNIPALAVTDFSRSAAHVAFVLYGLGLGFGIFVLSLLAIFLARFFAAEPEAPARGERASS